MSDVTFNERKGGVTMTNSVALRNAIEHRGLKLTFIAGALGLSRWGLYKKLDNKSEFKASEIAALSELLGLSTAEIHDIFLS